MTTVLDEVVAASQTHRRELLTYCYRMTGSLHDAEDLVQEVSLRAWRAADNYDPGRASLRTWLYRIATNACLTALEKAERRALPVDLSQPSDVLDVKRLQPTAELPWLEPCPDAWLDGSDPAAIVETRDNIRLAFIVALQHLPPQQRAVLILRDVLALRAQEVADLLEATVAAVNSALQRARAALAERTATEDTPAEPTDTEQRSLLDRYVTAFETMDIDALKRILRDDALLQMPPYLAWYSGPEAIGTFIATVFDHGGPFFFLPTRANNCPALGCYRRRDDGRLHAVNLHVLTPTLEGIARMDIFHTPTLFRTFGLPEIRW
jgi:RNA polymerase sigma-70 factor (ECF subfamily)